MSKKKTYVVIEEQCDASPLVHNMTAGEIKERFNSSTRVEEILIIDGFILKSLGVKRFPHEIQRSKEG